MYISPFHYRKMLSYLWRHWIYIVVWHKNQPHLFSFALVRFLLLALVPTYPVLRVPIFAYWSLFKTVIGEIKLIICIHFNYNFIRKGFYKLSENLSKTILAPVVDIIFSCD